MNHHDDIINYIVGCILHRTIVIDETNTNLNESIIELIDNTDEWNKFYEEIQNDINYTIENEYMCEN